MGHDKGEISRKRNSAQRTESLPLHPDFDTAAEDYSTSADNGELQEALAHDYSGETVGVRRIEGNAENFGRYGLPSAYRGDSKLAYYFYPTWRSQVVQLFWYFVTCVIAVYSSQWPEVKRYTVIVGELFPVGSTSVMLHLPLLALIPGFVLGKILFQAYNSRYIIDVTGVEAQIGIVSMYLRQPKLRFEDIRGVEPEQSLVERILGIGRVLIGSAMMAEVEITMEGVADPRAIQILINKERDRRMKMMQHGTTVERHALLASD